MNTSIYSPEEESLLGLGEVGELNEQYLAIFDGGEKLDDEVPNYKKNIISSHMLVQ